MEAHICVLQTALDVLKRQEVAAAAVAATSVTAHLSRQCNLYIVYDAVSSQK